MLLVWEGFYVLMVCAPGGFLYRYCFAHLELVVCFRGSGFEGNVVGGFFG